MTTTRLSRKGLRQILTEEWPDARYGEAGSFHDGQLAATGEEWDVIISDVSLPDKSGIELVKAICIARHANSDPDPVHSEELYANKALRAGACGYLPIMT